MPQPTPDTPWQTIVPDDVLNALTGPEVAVYRTAALANGQADPLPILINAVVWRARSKVGSCPRNRLGPDGTLPPEAWDDALRIIAWRLIERLPIRSSSALKEDRKKANDEAETHLDGIASGKYRIIQPGNEGYSQEQPGGPGVKLVNHQRNQATRHGTDGLI